MVVGIINTSNQGLLNEFVIENSITFPIIFDPGSPGGVQGGDTYDLYYMPNDGSPYPRDFIINQDGIIEYANNEIDTEWMLFIIDNLLAGDCVDWQLGDINSDSFVNVLDIIEVVNLILAAGYNEVVDMNQDGRVDILDIVIIVEIIISN